MVSRLGTETSPSSGSSSPTTMRKSVVFPAPLGPTSPTFSPGLSWNDASTNTSCLPYCLLILEKEIIQFQANRIPGGCVTGRMAEGPDKDGVVTRKDAKYTKGPTQARLRAAATLSIQNCCCFIQLEVITSHMAVGRS